jgi:c(7)-type cytochrome triheme protein
MHSTKRRNLVSIALAGGAALILAFSWPGAQAADNAKKPAAASSASPQAAVTPAVPPKFDPRHVPLGIDGIHDPANPSIVYLQEPSEALRDLPVDKAGNHVNWVLALDGGFIEPRKGLRPDTLMNSVNMDVVMDRTASMPNVVFPHRQHTQWLACTNCHTAIFLPKRDGNPVTMYAILNGQYCGVCHGKVAFPITDCFRCHNRPRDPRSLFK